MTDATDTTVQMPQAWKLEIDIFDESRMVPSEYGDYVEVGDVAPLVAEVNRLRARVQVLERALDHLACRVSTAEVAMLKGAKA